VPIEEKSTTGTGIQSSTPRYEKVTMKLDLTPYISPDSEAVRMKLKQTIKGRSSDTVTGSGGSVFPIFTDRGIESNIVVNNGDTAVLGGLVRDEEQLIETKVPLLGDVPVLGWLFKSSRREKRKLNLLVFLTPKIIRTQEDSQQQLSKKVNERIDWLKENADGRDPYGKKIESLPRASNTERARSRKQ
jgi:general secretion pathway protein D